MKAEEAKTKSIEMKPVYYSKCKQEALAAMYGKIQEAVDKGRGYISGGWDYQELGMGLILEELKKDGYYVRYRYTGNSMNCEIAWGEEEVNDFKRQDIGRVSDQEPPKKIKKWWNIF